MRRSKFFFIIEGPFATAVVAAAAAHVHTLTQYYLNYAYAFKVLFYKAFFRLN